MKESGENVFSDSFFEMTAFDEDGAARILSDSGRGMEMQRIEAGAAGQMWEADRIIVCGGNGAGKSTLGRKLAEASGYQFHDIEDYYFPETGSAYPYAAARTKEEVSRRQWRRTGWHPFPFRSCG